MQPPAESDQPDEAPVVHIRAVAYKGAVVARSTPTAHGEITRG
jgi:hypothetical protein